MALLLGALFPACQRKAPAEPKLLDPLVAAKNPAAEQIQLYNDISVADSVYQKKISGPQGLATLTPEEKTRYNRELADALFFNISSSARAEQILEATESLTPNFGIDPFDPNVRSEKGDTLLTASVKKGSKPLVEMFLRHGTDLSLKDANGKAALDLAREMKRNDLVALLSKGN